MRMEINGTDESALLQKQELQIEVKSNCFGIIVICNLRTNANLPLGAVNLVLKVEDEYFSA